MGKNGRAKQTARPSAVSRRNQIPLTYNDITIAFNAGKVDPAALRQQTLQTIEDLTGRPIICYVAKTLGNPHYLLPSMTPFDEDIAIDDNDILGFTDLINSTPKGEVDILIVSNGGSPLSAERIVKMLRQKFTHIRFIVPANAFSAATMICFSGDEIIMNSMSSTLGPVDPQFGSVPARAVLRGLEEIEQRFQKEGESVLSIYNSLLSQYSIHFLEMCKSAMRLSEELSKSWLKKYMFKEDLEKGIIHETDIDNIVTTFLNYDEHKDHGRSIDREKAHEFKLKVTNIEGIPGLEDLVQSVYYQFEKAFEISNFFKMYENTRGIAWGRLIHASAQISAQPVDPKPNSVPTQLIKPNPSNGNQPH